MLTLIASLYKPRRSTASALVLWLEEQCLELVTWVLLNVEDPIDPLDNDTKAGRLTHMSRVGHKSCLLRRAVLQCQVVIVDGEDLVLGAVNEEQTSAVRLVECAVFEERELVGGFGLELGEVSAIAELVAES